MVGQSVNHYISWLTLRLMIQYIIALMLRVQRGGAWGWKDREENRVEREGVGGGKVR